MKAGSGRVQGKNALVTGSASRNGIGFATARALAREGANVILTDLDEAEVSARAVSLQGEGLHALGIRHDVAREEDWVSAVDAAETGFGPIDVLVNNAGITILRTLDALTPADWAMQIDVNLKSVYLGCRTTLERMRRSGRRGSIINVSSVAGLVGMRRCTAYSASKGGIRLFTKSLALETAAEGIRINSVHPGVIQTDIQAVAMADGGEQSRKIHATIPMQRMGKPEEIAAMILFLASDEAGYITGGEFVVDGGLTAQ
jgi:NAD(P)-dependent dehydrogenase (short-subunit alcohol dehydrogenase family)